MFRELCQATLGRGQLRGRLLARLARFVHLDGARHHMGQAGDVVLEQVVAQPQAHGVNGRRLADGARQQYARRMPGLAGDVRPHVERSEAWQAVIGQNQVKGVEFELLQRLQAVDVDNVEAGAAALQGDAGKLVVSQGVFDVQNAPKRLHGAVTRNVLRVDPVLYGP